MNSSPKWASIPRELQDRPQWLIAGPDKAPLGISPDGRTYNASVTDSSTWLPFDVAARYAYQHGMHIGYVLHALDPFTCIDLDWCDEESQLRKGKPVDPSKWSTAEDWDRYYQIAQFFNSYTERSTYGKGLHIWVLGAIGVGIKTHGVEVYSQERFIITTGDALQPQAIVDAQPQLTQLLNDVRTEEMRAAPELVELAPLRSDEEVWTMAAGAANGVKFNDLKDGRWEQFGYPSQSEADLSLMSMLTFYSESNAQCMRLFRYTELGKREKAVKDDRYLKLTLKLVRGRQAREKARQAVIDIDELKRATSVRAEIGIDMDALVKQLNRAASLDAPPLHVQAVESATVAPQPLAALLAAEAPVQEQVKAARAQGLPFPPGFAGALAEFIFASAPRPVKEVSIVAALGLIAGICGKAWYISQSGLNVYIILVARSAVGKEAMHSGISHVIKEAARVAPAIYKMVQFADFASGPALMKACVAMPSFVNVAGEWGRKLKMIAQDDGRNAAMSSLRTVMTNLYQKSGPAAIVGGITYSNADNNVDSVAGVAFSMIGETTPGTFYDALNEQMMEDGFLSRFNIVEYNGERPPLNETPVTTPSKALSDHLGNLALMALSINGATVIDGNRRQPVPVDKTNEAAMMLKTFERECDAEINGTPDEAWRQMWNRASLKVMRIAALLAVSDMPTHPVIQEHHVEWSLDLVRRDIDIMQRKIKGGDVGVSDSTRIRKLQAVIQEYLVAPVKEGYKIPDGMRVDCVIPRKYLQIRIDRVNCFVNYRNGSIAALKDTISALVDSGYISEVPKDELVKKYGFHGRSYRVLELAPKDHL